MMNRKVIVPTLVLGVATLAGVAAYTSSASANDSTHRQVMIDTLAQKLNVSSDQISTALDEARAAQQSQRQAEMKEKLSTKLDQAVTDGVITAEQKQKIVDKRDELQAEIEKRQTEMEQWYKDNGIDQTKLRDYGVGMGGMGKMGGKGGRGMHGNW